MADTNIWPQIDQALSKPSVVHRNPKHPRITVDFSPQDEWVTWASLRRINADGKPGPQVDPPIVVSSSRSDGPDAALEWFLKELVQKVREL